MQTVLQLSALSKHFPTHRAVDQVSLSLGAGEFFCLIGPSGCGKTTTLRLIAGFIAPTQGDIVLEGKSITHLRPYERDVTTVFQNYALFPHLTVGQNVAFGLERRKDARQDVRVKVDRALELVQLGDKRDRLPHHISGGERQRVALARSLVVMPKVLLLDEPLSALDPKLRKQVRSELKALQREVGITFLFITHDQEEALSMSDRMAIMNAGRLEQVGTPCELYRNPQSKFAAEFLGEVNWLDGSGVRPEALHVSREQPVGNVRSLHGRVRHLTFLGNRVHLQATLCDGALCTVELDDARGFQAGDDVYVWWRADDEIRLPAAAAA